MKRDLADILDNRGGDRWHVAPRFLPWWRDDGWNDRQCAVPAPDSGDCATPAKSAAPAPLDLSAGTLAIVALCAALLAFGARSKKP